MKGGILSQTQRWLVTRADLPRLRVVDRYLLRELAGSFLAVTVILLLIVIGSAVADLLAKIARGRIPADLLFTLIGLHSIDALTILLPLAVFLGVLLAYGRLWRDSEMAVLHASGLGTRGLVRPLALLALPVMAVLAAVSFWLAPAADRLSQGLLEEASRSLIVAGLEPGRFVQLPGRDGVIYMGGMSDDGTRFTRAFIETESADTKGGGTRIDVITATHGFLYHDADGTRRYLALEDGFRTEGVLGQDNFRLLRFERNDVQLPDSDNDESDVSAKHAAPTAVVWQSRNDPVMRAELHWRLAAPLSALVLALLALPLARSNPREPRYARLLLAFLGWLVYYNCLNLGRGWIGQGRLAPEFGLWWVYLPTLAIALWLIHRQGRLRRRRQPA